jgi:hypothetical protein
MGITDELPDPNQVPSAEWLIAQLANEGDNAGADYNDGESILGYFGWDSVTVRHSVDGKIIRHELEIWWEPEELGGKKRHVRRFLIQEITGQRGAETVDV